jgi:eukaryotic-like serine/threonine-protein kinase
MSIKPRKGIQVGDTLDEKFTLLEHAAEGGMGSIFRAQRIEDGLIVAVKLLHKRFMEDSEAVERFMREAETISRLSHPCIIRVFSYGFDEVNNELYLAMEWLEGSDVDDLIHREGSLDPRYASWVALQVARCLSYAHGQGVIHRDLKPENIFIIPGATPADDQVKVLDFGIAKVLNNSNRPEITRVGIVCGTPEYMSPEQARASSTIDGRSDLYALGCVMFAMLTGRAPFAGNNPIAIMIQQQSDPLPPMNDDVPQPLQDIIYQATQKDREHRQPNLKAFGRQLIAILNDQPLPEEDTAASLSVDLPTVLQSASSTRQSSTATPKLTPAMIAAERDRLAAGGPARVSRTQVHQMTAEDVAAASREADLRISSGAIPKLTPDAIADAKAAEVAPQAAPKPAPQAAPKPAPQAAPQPAPQAAPQPAPPPSLATAPSRPAPKPGADKVLWLIVAALSFVVVGLFIALIIS